MDSFLDTCIVINFASYSNSVENKLNKKCYQFINNKKDKFIICYYVEDEIINRIRNRRIIYREIIEKIKSPEYNFDSSQLYKELKERDKIYVKKLYELYKNKYKNPEQLRSIFSSEQLKFEIKIDQFLKSILDEKVVPINSIDNQVLSVLKNFITNHADCLVLTSAVQEQQKRNLFLFVTSDEHFNPNNYDYIKEDIKLKEYKFPELKNLLYERE